MAEPVVAHVMGMPVRVEVRDHGAPAVALAAEVFAWLREVDARFSPFRAGSEVSRLARGELLPMHAHADVRTVLRACAALRERTDGFFDVRATGTLDPSGYVKGWAVERAAALLAAHGAQDFSVNAGGDLAVRGGPWRVGVQHPHRRGRIAAALELGDGAVATSGAYERGGHVRDPRTGAPAAGAVSVTVTGPDLATADAYATAAFAMGADGPAWTASLPAEGYEAMTVLPGGRVIRTAGFGRGPAARRGAGARSRRSPRGRGRRAGHGRR